MIVTVTPTIMDGTVVRWYLTDDPEAALTAPGISASRNEVRVNVPEDEIPPAIRAAAQAGHEALRRDPEVDLAGLATHRRQGLLGPLRPIKEVTTP